MSDQIMKKPNGPGLGMVIAVYGLAMLLFGVFLGSFL